MATAAAAMMARSRREIIDQLRGLGALSPRRAIDLVPERRIGRRVLERLIDAGVVHRTAAGKLWLDEGMYESYIDQKRTVAKVVAGGLAAILGVVLALR